jgi:hypothetical protein
MLFFKDCNNSKDDFSLHDLRLPNNRSQSTTSKGKPPPPPKKKRKLFIRGPIPFNWISEAARLPGKCLHVSVCLWFLAGLKRSRTVILPRSKLRLLGVGRGASYRGLKLLEQAGLVSVVREPGKNPIVTILEVDDEG